MENFWKKHSRGLFISAAFFACVSVALSIFVYMNFTAQREYAEYSVYLAETEERSAARSLLYALESDDKLEAYHSAAMSAVYASRSGETEAAAFFNGIANALKNGENVSEAAVREVAEFLEHGTLPSGILTAEPAQVHEVEERVTEGIASSYRMNAAGATANKIFGLDGALSAVTKSADGRLIFSCDNAYAVIDERSGMPVEVGISLPSSSPCLSVDDCDMAVRKFLDGFFSNEIAASATLTEVQNEGEAVYDMVYTCRDIEVCISVKRDTGRIIRLVMK